MKINKLALIIVAIATVSMLSHAQAGFDQNVTPDVIFGSGNVNGSFTTDQSNGVELGLRGKLRHNGSGFAENTFNSDGAGFYTFQAGVAPTQSFPTAEWSFEWSINTNWDGSSSWNLADLDYALSLDTDPGPGTNFTTFDPINDGSPAFWDHSIGDNSTNAATDSIATDATDYANLIAANNVAQNSWKPHWFFSPFDPTLSGVYTITLTAFDGATTVASSSININVVPEPTTLALGLSSLAVVAIGRRNRRKA
ncbi:MAG: PEP-CTERM sorting domain-containing protein [Planctomycetales bacterium]|nr:PEP-CTERM sorting domain-containing protein [Planctomycetales bacterium]